LALRFERRNSWTRVSPLASRGDPPGDIEERPALHPPTEDHLDPAGLLHHEEPAPIARRRGHVHGLIEGPDPDQARIGGRAPIDGAARLCAPSGVLAVLIGDDIAPELLLALVEGDHQRSDQGERNQHQHGEQPEAHVSLSSRHDV
jgi:hypothetical protein